MFITLSFPKYYLDEPINNSLIFDVNNDLDCEDNKFNMLDANVDNFMSLDYFSGYNASLKSYYMYPVDKPRKLMWRTLFDFSLIFLLYSV